jgi:HPt (histidine-containing phosphotransfer) domain-containing protein
MDDYLAKPIDARRLEAALDRWLEAAAPADAEEPEELAAASSEEAAGDDAVAQAPAFDRAGLRSRLMDDADLERDLIAIFLEDMPQQITVLEEAVAVGVAAAVHRCGHKIKGSALQIGAEGLRREAAAIEEAGKAGDVAAAAARLPQLRAAFAAAARAMSLPPPPA